MKILWGFLLVALAACRIPSSSPALAEVHAIAPLKDIQCGTVNTRPYFGLSVIDSEPVQYVANFAADGDLIVGNYFDVEHVESTPGFDPTAPQEDDGTRIIHQLRFGEITVTLKENRDPKHHQALFKVSGAQGEVALPSCKIVRAG